MNRLPWQQGCSLLIMTTLLGGCAGFGPAHTPSALLTPTQLSLADSSGIAPGQDWWQSLQDPGLNQLIAAALAHAPSLQLAQDRLQEALATVGLSQSQLGPHLDLNALDDRQRYSATGLLPAPIGGNFYNSYTLSLNASWELDFWGKTRAENRAALGAMQAAAWEARQARLVLTQAVIGQYTALQRQWQQQQVIDTRIQLAGSRIRLIQARVHAGLLSADTVDQATTGMAQLQAQSEALSGDIARSRHALAALSGQAPSALDHLQPATLQNTPTLDQARLGADLLGQRPDIASQRARVESLAQSVTAAQAGFYPNVSLSAFVGVNSLFYSQLFQHDARIVDFQPAFSLPLFHSGQLQANLHQQQSRYDQAVDSYNQTLLDALKNTADALTAQQQASAQLTEARRAVSASQKAADAMTLRLRAGLVNKLEVLDSLDQAQAQKSVQLDAQANARLAWATLNTALGGGVASAQPPR